MLKLTEQQQIEKALLEGCIIEVDSSMPFPQHKDDIQFYYYKLIDDKLYVEVVNEQLKSNEINDELFKNMNLSSWKIEDICQIYPLEDINIV